MSHPFIQHQETEPTKSPYMDVASSPNVVDSKVDKSHPSQQYLDVATNNDAASLRQNMSELHADKVMNESAKHDDDSMWDDDIDTEDDDDDLGDV